MSNVWFWSDQHFFHAKTFTTFKKSDGVTPLRPFTNVDEMQDTMVKNHNRIVGKNDLVYWLGDVTLSNKYLPLVSAFNGRKKLVRGNHDNAPTEEYLKYFESIYGVKVLNGMILSHIPLHRGSVIPRMGCNVHGHLHGADIPDGAYFSVCVENIDFTPIELSDLKNRIKEKKEKYFNLEYGNGGSGNGPG